MTRWLISLYPEHADAVLNGSKSIEVRRSKVPCAPGDVVLIYATVPHAKIVGAFSVKHTERRAKDSAWRVWRKDLPSTSREQWEKYFDGRDLAYGIFIGESVRIDGPSLASMRGTYGIHPPQGWVKVPPVLTSKLQTIF